MRAPLGRGGNARQNGPQALVWVLAIGEYPNEYPGSRIRTGPNRRPGFYAIALSEASTESYGSDVAPEAIRGPN